MPTKKKFSIRGFTLLELSITMVITGIIAVGYLSYKQFNLDNTARTETLRRIKVIEDTILLNLAQNGNLPCPANPSEVIGSTLYGVVNMNFADPLICNPNSGNDLGSMNLGGDTLYYGTIPTNSIGIPSEYMIDGWGNRFGYVVQKTFINSQTSSSACINTAGDFAQDNHSNAAYFCFKGQASGSANPSTPDIQILNRAGGSVISNDAVYVIISYGPNGYGAYLRNSDRNSGSGTEGSNVNRNPMPPAANDDEQLNLGCNPTTNSCSKTFYSPQFVSRSPSSDFDDIVVYKDRNLMVRECNAYFNNACTIKHGIYIK
ncbi:type II secretion system protein [Candidatus Jidaibacter acanthamoebae]|nr:type II secretion system protein [Candidatus Jidaibacter acanthamoeba]